LAVGLVALVAVGSLAAWVAARDGTAREEALLRACALLDRGRAGDREALSRARRAFRDATGGAFADRLPHFGVHITDEIERALGGTPPADPAVAAIARGDYHDAERLFAARAGAVAEHGVALARTLQRSAGAP
jgi:hypothetical protein